MPKAPIIALFIAVTLALTLVAFPPASSAEKGRVSGMVNTAYTESTEAMATGGDYVSQGFGACFSLFNPCLDLIKSCAGLVMTPLEYPFDAIDGMVGSSAKPARSKNAKCQPAKPKNK